MQFLNGRFRGKAGVKRLYIDRFANTFVKGRNGPVHGFLLDHLQAQDIVDFYPDTSPPKTKARFRALMSAGNHDSMDDTLLPRAKKQWWEGGVYENEYIKEDGVWKIFRLRYYPFWHGEFDQGWQHTAADYVPPFSKLVTDGDPLGPDEFVQNDERLWPDTRVVPFHYAHPVTGEMVAEEDLRAPVLGGKAEDAKPARVLEDAF